MKLFALYADVKLTYEPDWLEPFRVRYGQLSPYHITLKQPCHIDEVQAPDVRQAAATFFHGYRIQVHSIPLSFDRIMVDEEDMSVMVMADRHVGQLHDLQASLVKVFSDYKSYYEPGAATWEKHFRPHLTIAADLTPELLKQARQAWHEDDLPQAVTEQVTLVIAGTDSERTAPPQILIHFKL